MKHYFGGILRRIYKPCKEFFIKSPYPYLSKCTEALNVIMFNRPLISFTKPLSVALSVFKYIHIYILNFYRRINRSPYRWIQNLRNNWPACEGRLMRQYYTEYICQDSEIYFQHFCTISARNDV